MEIIRTRLSQRPVTNYPRPLSSPLRLPSSLSLSLSVPCPTPLRRAAIAGRCNNCSRQPDWVALSHSLTLTVATFLPLPLTLSVCRSCPARQNATVNGSEWRPACSASSGSSRATARALLRQSELSFYLSHYFPVHPFLSLLVNAVRQLQFVARCNGGVGCSSGKKKAATTSMGRKKWGQFGKNCWGGEYVDELKIPCNSMLVNYFCELDDYYYYYYCYYYFFCRYSSSIFYLFDAPTTLFYNYSKTSSTNHTTLSVPSRMYLDDMYHFYTTTFLYSTTILLLLIILQFPFRSTSITSSALCAFLLLLFRLLLLFLVQLLLLLKLLLHSYFYFLYL